jgi:copper(I)-binding protein
MRITAILACAMLTSCGQPATLDASGAWIRLPAVAGRPGAAYFTLHGGTDPMTLVKASTPAAIRSELHESTEAGGVMKMAAIRDVPLPAGGTLAFAPGGKHVMLFDIAPNVRAGDTVPLYLSFAEGKRLTVPAKLVAAGEEPPK